MAWSPAASDTRAWTSFDAKSQKTLKSGGTITGGDGRKFVLIDGHAVVVGSKSYTDGMALRQQNANPANTAKPVGTPLGQPTSPVPTAPGAFPETTVSGNWSENDTTPYTPTGPYEGMTAVANGTVDPSGVVAHPAAALPPVPTPAAPDPAAAAAKLAADQAAAAAKVATDAANRDALASIKNVLGQYGLDSLSDFAWQEIVSGRSGNEVLQDIRETPQFKQRFPAIEARQRAGLPPLSPGDYVSYENTATQYMRDAGLPKGFYDSPEDFTKFLTNDVSLKELGERVNLAKDAAYNAPTEVRSALRGQFGLGDGDLAAFFLDPNKAQPLLQRTYSAAQIAGAGTRTGYNINADQDYRLADLGVTAQQAQSGFNTLQQSQELFNPLTGHSNEGAITTDQQLGAAFGGNAADNQLVERRRSQRQADFADGGGFAANQQGLAGLGSASK